jgi:hypothetical protein
LNWYAHRIAGFTIVELQLTDDYPELLDYLVLRLRRSNISIWDVHRLL